MTEDEVRRIVDERIAEIASEHWRKVQEQWDAQEVENEMRRLEAEGKDYIVPFYIKLLPERHPLADLADEAAR